MGILRLLLAASVLFGHGVGMGFLSNKLTAGFLHPYYCVQCFFVMSGFYMSLILHEKYEKSLAIFYINRYLRIIAPYLLVLFSTMIVGIYLKEVFPATKTLHNIDGKLNIIILILLNISIVGQDIISFLTINNENGSAYMLVPQAWSLAAELFFYLISPYLIKQKTTTLIIITIFFCVLRIPLVFLNFDFYPWQQRFVFFELSFFIVGIFSHRIYLNNYRLLQNKYIQAIFIWLISLMIIHFNFHAVYPEVLVGYKIIFSILKSFYLALIFMFGLPFVFKSYRSSQFDKNIGNLSYQLYLWHVPVAFVIWYYFPYKFDGLVLLFTSLIFSIATIYLVERPVNLLRKKIYDIGNSKNFTLVMNS